MSRSFKKNGIIKDGGRGRNLYNRKFRRVNRQLIGQGLEPIAMKELVNQYDVCDWVFHWNEQYWLDVFENENHRLRHFYKSYKKAWLRYFGK